MGEVVLVMLVAVPLMLIALSMINVTSQLSEIKRTNSSILDQVRLNGVTQAAHLSSIVKLLQ